MITSLYSERIVITPECLRTVPRLEILRAMKRCFIGDWGKISSEDADLNDEAMQSGGRVMGVYESFEGVTFWVIIDENVDDNGLETPKHIRYAATALLPSEY